MYRELKLRGAILSEKRLRVLPQETVINTVNGVWNLSSDQARLNPTFFKNYLKIQTTILPGKPRHGHRV